MVEWLSGDVIATTNSKRIIDKKKKKEVHLLDWATVQHLKNKQQLSFL